MRNGLLLIIALTLAPALPAQERPFILVSESDYPELRARAAAEPWATMKADAIDDVMNLSYDPAVGDFKDRCELVHAFAASAALAVIVDPDHAAVYVQRVEDVLHPALLDLEQEKKNAKNSTRHSWAYNVVAAGTTLVSYLCLDVFHAHLDGTKLAEMEAACDYFAASHRDDAWRTSAHAIKGVRDLYHGNTGGFVAHVADYRAILDQEVTPGGVFLPGGDYAAGRMTGEKRMQKTVFLDLCSRHGAHDFYNDPEVQNLFEWIYGSGLTPWRKAWTFSDAKTRIGHVWDVRSLTVHHFSEEAARRARWACGPDILPEEDDEPRRLVHYVLMDRARATEALWPSSTVYDQGGLSFYEDRQAEDAMAIAMWNIQKVDGHSDLSHQHKDTNAFDFVAYGARLLRNSGYDGWDNGDWTWINKRAKSGNTVLIDNVDHQNKTGAGIVEHILSSSVDYACGDSGDALPNGRHWRNLCFVRPQGDLQGYVVLFDRVLADDARHRAGLALHPNTDQEPVVVSDKQEYRLRHTGEDWVPNTAEVNVFFGSPPASVSVNTGYLAGNKSDDQIPEARYLWSQFDTDSSGEAMLTTVLFPHDESHPKKPMTRLNPTGATGGVRIDLSGTVSDYALSSLGDSVVTSADGSSFQGQAVLYRRNAGKLSFYLLRGGRSFDDGSDTGVSADRDCSVFLAGDVGRIICSAAATITFSQPGITGVELDEVMLDPIDQVDGAVTVTIPTGSHQLRLHRVPQRVDTLQVTPDNGDIEIERDDGQRRSPGASFGPRLANQPSIFHFLVDAPANDG